MRVAKDERSFSDIYTITYKGGRLLLPIPSPGSERGYLPRINPNGGVDGYSCFFKINGKEFPQICKEVEAKLAELTNLHDIRPIVTNMDGVSIRTNNPPSIRQPIKITPVSRLWIKDIIHVGGVKQIRCEIVDITPELVDYLTCLGEVEELLPEIRFEIMQFSFRI